MIIKESELIQGSEAWHKFRSSGIGGSEIASVMGCNPYQTAYQLWLIKTGKKQAEDISNNFAVKRGHALEPKAREIINSLGYNFEPVIFQHDDIPYMKYSSDGYDSAKNELLEIKAPGERNHVKVIETGLPLDYYVDQLQWALMISGCRKIHFVSYCPMFPEPIVRLEVLPDLARQEDLKVKAKEFWNMVTEQIQPELSESDFVDLSCEEFSRYAKDYSAISKEIKRLEAELDKIKKQIAAFANGRNMIANGFKVFSSQRKGSIDYQAIPELKNIDVEKYRKLSSDIFYIKEIKA
jgi:putative phage-type endonuclease